MFWHTGAGMGWWMLFGGFIWIVFWATVIYLIVSLVRRPEDQNRGELERPIEIAKRRYASGQITREEYERIRHDLAA